MPSQGSSAGFRPMRGGARLFVCLGLLAGCASSGDVEALRQEREQAKTKIRTEARQEQERAAAMAQESAALRAKSEELEHRLQTMAGGRPLAAAGPAMSLTAALATPACRTNLPAAPPNPAVAVLAVDATTPCSHVAVGVADATFTAQAPLLPVVIGQGGTLTLQDQAMTLYASSFLIRNGGTMEAGSATAPIQSHITIVMAGRSSASPPPATGDATPNARDITVMDGGVLQLYGGKGLSAPPDGTSNDPAKSPAFINTLTGTNGWTYLAAPAGPPQYNDAANVGAPVPAAAPDTTLTLATTVDWQVNDWVSVATTGFSSHQTEIVQVCGKTTVPNPEASAPHPIPGVPATVSRLTLCQKLKHYHYGGLAPTPGFFPAGARQSVVAGGRPIDVGDQAKSFYDDASRNYGIDERAEVALLSRAITLTSAAGQSGDPNTFMGGHLAVLLTVAGQPAPTLHLVGVEIEKFGQALLGRYPVHLHRLAGGSDVLIQDVSVHHGYNKCYVVHGTGHAKLYNNACVRTVGQGVYLEDGTDIVGNRFMRNHVAGTMAAQTTYSYPRRNGSLYWDGDNLQATQSSAAWYTIANIPDTSASGANGALGPDLYHPGGFWITNLGNTFVNNSVAGCQAMGRGYWLLAQNGQLYAYPEFTGNRVHGCYNGLDTQPDAVQALDPKPTMSGTADDQAPVLLLNGNTVTRSRQRAFWGRGIFFALHNNRFATNPYGFSLLGGGGPEGNLPAFWGLASDNVIAGMTRNNVERYPGCPYGNVPGSAPPLLTWQTECTDVALGTGAAWGNYPSASMNIQGYSYYDGPARIEHNRFVNFRFDPTGLHPEDPAARLLTTTDIANIKNYGGQGQLEGPLITSPPASAPQSAVSAHYQGYAGDPATGWIQSNQQAVPPTQYIEKSIWENVDFKHQVYTEAVNMGPFNDGDKTTVILDRDGQLTGLRVVAGGGAPTDGVPVSLNNLDYYATDYTVDEPHSRGPNDFRATSLMSPHRYATLNIESVDNPPAGFRVDIRRDMPAYGDTAYPGLFMNGRGQNPIYEPFVMDRMGYTVYGRTGTEHAGTAPAAFMNRLLFSYTDPPVKASGEYFVTRIAVSQPIATPAGIRVFRVRRQWGQQYTGGVWPPGFNPPGPVASSCDGVFFANQGVAEPRWQDCLNRAANRAPYSGGVTLAPATDWASFEKRYTDLLAGALSVADFVKGQTFYYDAAHQLLYFHMIEDQPVQRMPAPYGTCGGGKAQYAANVAQVRQIKSFSDPNSVKAALDAACLVVNDEPQPTDLFTCGVNGCAAYLVDYTKAAAPITGATNAAPIVITTTSAPPTGSQVSISGVQGNSAANGTWTVTNLGPTSFSLNGSAGNGAYTTGGAWVGPIAACSPCVPPHPITRAAYSGWNQYTLVYATPQAQPNGLPVQGDPAKGNPAPPTDGTPLVGLSAPKDGIAPPAGDQVTYSFLPLSGPPVTVTENFAYHCVTTPPWSPVNARGAYPPQGGFTYPLHDSVCTMPPRGLSPPPGAHAPRGHR